MTLETEIERMVVRLVGDDSSYQDMAVNADQITRKLTDSISSNLNPQLGDLANKWVEQANLGDILQQRWEKMENVITYLGEQGASVTEMWGAELTNLIGTAGEVTEALLASAASMVELVAGAAVLAAPFIAIGAAAAGVAVGITYVTGGLEELSQGARDAGGWTNLLTEAWWGTKHVMDEGEEASEKLIKSLDLQAYALEHTAAEVARHRVELAGGNAAQQEAAERIMQGIVDKKNQAKVDKEIHDLEMQGDKQEEAAQEKKIKDAERAAATMEREEERSAAADQRRAAALERKQEAERKRREREAKQHMEREIREYERQLKETERQRERETKHAEQEADKIAKANAKALTPSEAAVRGSQEYYKILAETEKRLHATVIPKKPKEVLADRPQPLPNQVSTLGGTGGLSDLLAPLNAINENTRKTAETPPFEAVAGLGI